MRRYPVHLYTLVANTLAVVLAAALSLTVSTQQAQAATVTVQAESYAAQSGVTLEATSDTGGGQNASYLADGDWLRFDNVDLGAAGRLTVSARIASAAGSGTVELRTAGLTGPLLAVIPVSPTGGWQNWATRTTQVTTHPTGSQTVFAVLRGATPVTSPTSTGSPSSAKATPRRPDGFRSTRPSGTPSWRSSVP